MTPSDFHFGTWITIHIYTLIPNSVLKISSVDIDLCLNSLMLMVCYSLDSVQTPHNVLPQHSVWHS